jgi:hypothetical protein
MAPAVGGRTMILSRTLAACAGRWNNDTTCPTARWWPRSSPPMKPPPHWRAVFSFVAGRRRGNAEIRRRRSHLYSRPSSPWQRAGGKNSVRIWGADRSRLAYSRPKRAGGPFIRPAKAVIKAG